MYSINADQIRTPTYISRPEQSRFYFEGFPEKDEADINNQVHLFAHDNWVYNPVFGNLLTQDPPGQTSSCQNGCVTNGMDPLEGQIPVHWWRTKTGASKVAEISPLAPQTSEVDGETPLHWRNTPRWNIPQIEVRITGHWIIRYPRNGSTQSSGSEDCTHFAPDGIGSKSPSSDSKRMHSMPRLRLVTDREWTGFFEAVPHFF